MVKPHIRWWSFGLMVTTLVFITACGSSEAPQVETPQQTITSSKEKKTKMGLFGPLPAYQQEGYEPDIQGLSSSDAKAVRELLTSNRALDVKAESFKSLNAEQQAEVLRIAKAERRIILGDGKRY